MPRIYLSLGSNLDRERHLREAVAALRTHFGELALSPVYENAPVGFEGPDFYNLVVAFDSALDVHEVAAVLRRIEAAAGRDRSQPRFSSRSLDVDLLLYGDAVRDEPGLVLPRPEILSYAFVLRPLADLAPQLVHPVRQQTMATLWKALAPAAPPLRALELVL